MSSLCHRCVIKFLCYCIIGSLHRCFIASLRHQILRFCVTGSLHCGLIASLGHQGLTLLRHCFSGSSYRCLFAFLCHQILRFCVTGSLHSRLISSLRHCNIKFCVFASLIASLGHNIGAFLRHYSTSLSGQDVDVRGTRRRRRSTVWREVSTDEERAKKFRLEYQSRSGDQVFKVTKLFSFVADNKA